MRTLSWGQSFKITLWSMISSKMRERQCHKNVRPPLGLGLGEQTTSERGRGGAKSASQNNMRSGSIGKGSESQNNQILVSRINRIQDALHVPQMLHTHFFINRNLK